MNVTLLNKEGFLGTSFHYHANAVDQALASSLTHCLQAVAGFSSASPPVKRGREAPEGLDGSLEAFDSETRPGFTIRQLPFRQTL
jgi:hypothetical protein